MSSERDQDRATQDQAAQDRAAQDRATLPDEYFEAVYAASDDPWHFETSAYEDAKYTRTLAALTRAHYERALEVGCSIGVLTGRLADRCGALLSVDVSERALERARARNAGSPQVRFERRRLPEAFPPGPFDLILLSEVGYYWSRPDLEEVLRRAVASLVPGGQLLAVHWTPEVHDYPLTGDEVHAVVETFPGLRLLHAERQPQYRLALLERAEAT